MADDQRLLSSTSGQASPLFWALLASTFVHTALVAMPQVLPGTASGARVQQGVVLQAELLPASEPESADKLAVSDALSPVRIAAQDVATSPALPTGVRHPPAAPPSLLGVGSSDVQIAGQALVDRNRLGDLLSRQMIETPIEVDFPARLKEPIRVRYPEAALAAGREDSVAVWVAVNPEGVPEEVVVVDGSPEFADAVVAAVKEARFVPAENNHVPMRYPVSLQFDFTLGIRPAPGASAANR